jgi:NitT/TauT family transport system permease protein
MTERSGTREPTTGGRPVSAPPGRGSTPTEAMPLPAEPSGPSQAVPERPVRRRRRRPPNWLLRLVTGVLLLLLWEAGARLLDSPFVARPWGVAQAVPEVFATETFWQDAWATIGSVVYGVLIGAAAGLVLGLAMGRIKLVRWFFTSYVSGTTATIGRV